MSADRKFYATQLTITILSADEPWDGDLRWLSFDVGSEGDYVGNIFETMTVELIETEMAEELINAGSDPDFFAIDEEVPPTKVTFVVTAEGVELE